MHVPQSDEARIEAQMLLAVNENVIATKNGAPCMNLVQNHRLTACLMTYDHMFIDRTEAMHLLYTLQHRATRNGEPIPECCLRLPTPAIVRPKELWTTRQLVSCTLPNNFTLRMGELDKKLLNCTERPPTLIWRGELLYGVLNGKQSARIISALGGSALPPNDKDVDVQGSAPRACINAVAQFINGMTALTEAYMCEHGFSIGIGDVVSDVEQRIIVRHADKPSTSMYAGKAPSVFCTELAAKRDCIETLERQCGADASSSLDDILRVAHKERASERRRRAALQQARTTASGAAVASVNSARDANLTNVLARAALKRKRKIAAIDVLRTMLLGVSPGIGSLRINAMARETLYWSSLRLTEVERNVDLVLERVVRARRSVRQKSEDEIGRIIAAPLSDPELDALVQLRTEHAEQVALHCADNNMLDVDASQRAVEAIVQGKREVAAECRARVVECQRALDTHAAEVIDAVGSSVGRRLLEAHESEASLHEELARDGAMQFEIKRIADACEPRVQEVIAEHRREAREMAAAGVGESSYGASVDALEAKIRKVVTDTRTAVQTIVFAALPRHNSFRMMAVEAESKGTITNVSDVMGMIGQQEIDGRRLCDTYLTSVDSVDNDANYGGSSARAMLQPTGYRMLPHEKRGYPGAVAGGFIKSSLLRGCRPKEFWSYATSARKNIGDTAIGTAPTGYMSRCIVKVVEDKCTDARGAVRAADNTIVQMRAGGTGYNPRFLQTRACPPLSMSDAQLASCVFIDSEFDIAAYDPSIVAAQARRDATRNFMCSSDAERDAERVALLLRERTVLREAIDYVRGMTDADTQGSLCTVGDIEALIAQTICRDDGGACAAMAHSVNLPYTRCAAPAWSPTLADADEYGDWRMRVDAVRLADYGHSDDARAELGLLDECAAIVLVGDWIDSLGSSCDDVTRCELRLRLCAKQVVRRHQMSRAVLLSFMHCYAGWLRRAVCVAGDPVAVIAGQSFSSIGMQMTLNSVARNTELLLFDTCTNLCRRVQIGDWIDAEMVAAAASGTRTVQHVNAGSEYLELAAPVLVPTVDEHGATSWAPLTAVTRHPPHGDLVRITTRGGRSVVATRSKSLLVWDGDKLVQTCGADAKLGDLLPTTAVLNAPRKVYECCSVADNVALCGFAGAMLGVHLANGFAPSPTLERVPAEVFGACDEFVRDLLGSYISVGGTVNADDGHLVMESHSAPLIADIAALSARFGVFGCVSSRHRTHTFSVCNHFAARWALKIGSACPAQATLMASKSALLVDKVDPTFKTVGPIDAGVVLDPIVSIELVPAEEHPSVYDVTVPSTLNFCIANGLGCADTFHSTGATNVCVVEGMPRALEVLDARVTKRMETPVTTIFAESRTMATRGAARYMMAAIKKLSSNGVAMCMQRLEHAWALMGRDTLSNTLTTCSARQLATQHVVPQPLPKSPPVVRKRQRRQNGRQQPSAQQLAAREREAANYEYSVARANAAYRRELSVPLMDALAAFDVNVVTEFATTLDSMAYGWRTVNGASEFAQHISTSVVVDRATDMLLRRGAHGCVLTALVHDAFVERIAAIAPTCAVSVRRSCVELLMNVVWEQLLPHVGTDRSFVVLPLYDSSGRWNTIVIALLHCETTEACKLYDLLRQRRAEMYVQFDDVAVGAMAVDGTLDTAIVPYRDLQQQLAAAAINVGAEAEQRAQIDGDRVLFGPLHRLMQSTVLRDVVQSVELRYAPLERTNDDELRLTIPLECGESERETMREFYATAVSFGEGCQSAECARNGDAPADRVENRSCFSRSQPSVCCMSSFVLALRLDRKWFARREYSVAHLCSLLDRALGAAYHTVTAGDINTSDGYISLHIRLHTCQLDVLRKRKIECGTNTTTAGNMVALLNETMLTENERSLDEHARAVRQTYEYDERERRTEFALNHPWFIDEMRRQRRDNAALPDITDETLDAQYWQLLTQFVIHELERSLYVAMSVSLRGGIETRAASVEHHTCVRYTPERGAEQGVERVLAVDSRDYAALMRVRQVDRRRTFTNAICDVHDALGLIAARDLIADELSRIIESGHSFVHRAHLMVLADIFMYKGDYLPMTVHGLQKLGAEPIQIMSFEESSNMASNAAVNELVVPEMRSPSSCIALGIAVRRLGTEACTLVHDQAVIERAAASGVLFVPPEIYAQDVFATEIALRIAGNVAVQPFAMLSPSDAYGDEMVAAAAAHQSDWQHNHELSEYAGVVDECGIVDEHATYMTGANEDDDDMPTGVMSPVHEDDWVASSSSDDDASVNLSDLEIEPLTPPPVEEYDPTHPAMRADDAYSPTRPAYSPTQVVEEYDPMNPQIDAVPPSLFMMRGAMFDTAALLEDLPISYQ